MQTIITVIFFGILTYGVAQNPVANGNCQNTLPAKRDLNAQNFFKGSWYVTHMKDGSNEAICREYKTNIEGSLIKLKADGEYTFKGVNKFYTTNCSSVSGTTLNPPTGQYVLKCRHIYGGKENIFFDLMLSIIETDYSNYALVYRCTTYPSLNLKYGNLLLLQRNKGGDVSKVNSQKYKSLLQQFKKTAGC